MTSKQIRIHYTCIYIKISSVNRTLYYTTEYSTIRLLFRSCEHYQLVRYKKKKQIITTIHVGRAAFVQYANITRRDGLPGPGPRERILTSPPAIVGDSVRYDCDFFRCLRKFAVLVFFYHQYNSSIGGGGGGGKKL